ncbi:class I SAM-dependent methyltransferase [Aquimarina sp. MMG016]|uniref:class I SAM-dependent DNA methyltransferase n=1 Tax=Aquimarina sp. MMG016 TaxID=2822690 RepID=UPI001B3A4416|nr:class I SAM-dependent methyltransferase [Aquimarina sp. MMG016]MBQ4821845.1 class I SAM-dependent methyltransferase [Aquimarina sp. MMG016]
MGKLYSDLAVVYEAMYATFIDYLEEYNFYSKIINRYNKKNLLEIGSGTGNLASYFVKKSFDYQGLDFSKEMIAIAKAKVPNCKFIEGDMRNFKLEKPIQSIIMTGRTISYLVTNEDVKSTFLTVNKNLEKGGVFCFDFIDAYRFIPEIFNEKRITHKATYNNINYMRKSIWELNLESGMDVQWTSKYYKEVKNEWIEIGEDHANVRTFLKSELEIFLTINGFAIKDIIERKSYFFPTYVIVAEKK